jgi:putative transposase
MPLMRPKSLSSLIVGFKSAATKQINCRRHARGTPVWQRNYHDQIIRDDTALHHLRHYVHQNPRTWQTDQLHPSPPSCPS